MFVDKSETSQCTVLLSNVKRGGREYGSTGVDCEASGSRTLPIPFSVAESCPFPFRSVLILAFCMTVNTYTLVSLFPYVGIMVKGLLGLDTENEVGEWYQREQTDTREREREREREEERGGMYTHTYIILRYYWYICSNSCNVTLCSVLPLSTW